MSLNLMSYKESDEDRKYLEYWVANRTRKRVEN